MLASSVLSDSELLLLSSLEERVKNEAWMKPNQQDLHPSNICLGAQELQKELQRDISTSCNPHTSFGWQLGRAPAALPTFHTIPLETAIGKTKSALPSHHHPQVLEDSWTSHSVSQPV